MKTLFKYTMIVLSIFLTTLSIEWSFDAYDDSRELMTYEIDINEYSRINHDFNTYVQDHQIRVNFYFPYDDAMW